MPEPRAGLDPALAAAVARLDELVEGGEAALGPAAQEHMVELLRTVDAVHRAGLSRLAAYLGELGEDARRRILGDPAVRLLLELYDLLAPEPGPPPGFVPLEDVRLVSAPRRSWVTVAGLADLPPDGVLSLMVDQARVMLARVGGRVVAYEDASGASPLPVGFGHREGDVVVCPWHGCRFDLATGRRVGAAGESLTSLPVEVVSGEVRVEVTARPVVSTLGAEAGP